MTNAELIAKIKAEIERRITDNTFGAKLELIDILAWLSTLESENPVPKDLEEAAHSYSESDEPLYSPGHRFHWDDDALFGKQIETAFIAGAEWQKEQMPAEWSEEDEFFRQQLIVYCEKGIQDPLAAKCVDWLKSFHPHSFWKPSEEQIYSLGTVIKGMGYVGVGSVGYNLKELYEQLKKL